MFSETGQIIRHLSETCIYVEVELILEVVSWEHLGEMLHVLFCRILRSITIKIFISWTMCFID